MLGAVDQPPHYVRGSSGNGARLLLEARKGITEP
jgi:hypothetical protein